MTKAAKELFVATPPGLESVTEAEVLEVLRAAGFDSEAEGVRRTGGGVELSGDARVQATLLLNLSTASRVLVRLGSFRARGFPELERRVKSVALDAVHAAGRPVRLEITSRKSRLYHTGAIEERIRRVLDLPEGGSGDDDDSDADQGRAPSGAGGAADAGPERSGRGEDRGREAARRE